MLAQGVGLVLKHDCPCPSFARTSSNHQIWKKVRDEWPWPGVIADHCNCWIIVVYSLSTEGYLFSVLPFCWLATEGWLHGKGLLVKQVFASPVSENTTERTSVGKGAARLKSWLCICICILLQPCPNICQKFDGPWKDTDCFAQRQAGSAKARVVIQ